MALIIDDHPLFCEALSITLTAMKGVADVRTVGRLDDALAGLEAGETPDVILLDLHLPDVAFRAADTDADRLAKLAEQRVFFVFFPNKNQPNQLVLQHFSWLILCQKSRFPTQV